MLKNNTKSNLSMASLAIFTERIAKLLIYSSIEVKFFNANTIAVK